MAVGSYRRLEEIGRGSFATVYKASKSVSSPSDFPHIAITLSLLQHRVLPPQVYAITSQGRHEVVYQVDANAPDFTIETTRLRCHQIRRPAQA